jgi:hypothetical protein
MSSNLKAAIEHEIEVTQMYSPILRAAGIDPSNLTSIQIFELSGYIERDDEVIRRYWQLVPAVHPTVIENQSELLLAAIEGMDAATRRALAERCAKRMM